MTKSSEFLKMAHSLALGRDSLPFSLMFSVRVSVRDAPYFAVPSPGEHPFAAFVLRHAAVSAARVRGGASTR